MQIIVGIYGEVGVDIWLKIVWTFEEKANGYWERGVKVYISEEKWLE